MDYLNAFWVGGLICALVKVSRIYIAFIESMAAAVFIVPLWCI